MIFCKTINKLCNFLKVPLIYLFNFFFLIDSHGHSSQDEDPFISNGVSPSKPANTSPKNDSIQGAHEIESTHVSLNEINNCNGSFDEAVVEASASDSETVPKLYHKHSLENSVQHSEDNTVSDNKNLEPPSLNHYDHDLLNSESTDSFQSEVFDAQSAKSNAENSIAEQHKDDSNCEVSEKHTGNLSSEISEEYRDELRHEVSMKSNAGTNYESSEKRTSHEQDNNLENDFSYESNVKKIIDVDNLTLSQLKVRELLGHTEEILSVAADEDFILSSR